MNALAPLPVSQDDFYAAAPPPALDNFKHILRGYKNFQVLRSAMECGLFDWLDEQGSAQKPALVTVLGLRGAHSTAWLQCLVELGCLTLQEGAYALHPDWRELLLGTGEWSGTALVQDLTQAHGRWSALADFMCEDKHNGLRPPATLSTHGMNLHPLRHDAQVLAQHLLRHPRAANAQNVLCFDASEGVLAVLLNQTLAPARLHVVVPPAQEDAARTALRHVLSGSEAYCTFQTGSAVDFSTDASFDLAVLFHSLYAVRRTTNEALAAVAATLSPGGVLCAAHWFCLEACEPAPGGLNQLEQAIINDFHPMCHVETFCDRLWALGLEDVVKEDLAGEYGTVKLHLAQQP